jgi:hypothetical protein
MTMEVSMRPFRTVLVLVALSALVAAPASAEDQDLPAYRSSANFQLVAHLPGAGGTDLEFFSRDLTTWKDGSGTINTVPDGEPLVTRHFAFVGNRVQGPSIVDITNPEAPFVVASFPSCKADQGDIQVASNGKVASIAMQGGTCPMSTGVGATKGAILVDMTDVYAPRIVGNARETIGAHNTTIHPSGNYVYISTSGDVPNRIAIFDIRDPATPIKVRDFSPPSGDSPHDIRFSEDGTRAYMAGIDQYRIVDTSDPENPKMITTFVPPGTTIGHDALVTPDKAFLFVGEETNGGSTAPCPGGPIYIYDIRGANEQNPVLLGIAEAGSGPVTGRTNDEAFAGAVGGCTSHVMDLAPNKKSLTAGWYVSGSRTFDFSGLYNADGTPKPTNNISWGAYGTGAMKETGWIVPQGGNTWSAKQYAPVPGYIFSDDLVLGFYVTKIKA